MFHQLSIYIIAILSYFVPKKKNFYIFIPTHDLKHFSGNVKALALHLKENHKNVQIKVFSPRTFIRKEIRKEGVDVLNKRVIWSFLRAQYFIIDTFFVPNEIRKGNFQFIQLWHGSGFKEVGLRNDTRTKSLDAANRALYKKCKLFITTSEADALKQNLSYDTTVSVVTGYPRNDIFFKKNEVENIKHKHQLESFSKIFCYVPTFRDLETKSPFSLEFWKKLDDYLVEKNQFFVIKKHPYETFLQIPSTLRNIKDLSDEIDTQELLLISDLLISDYSSVMTDFVITGRPVIVYAYDFDDYLKRCRALYYELSETLPQPIVKSQEELFNYLTNIDWIENPEIKKSYLFFQKTFHTYLDGKSSERVLKEILKL